MAAILTPGSASPLLPTDPVTFTVTDADEALTTIMVSVRQGVNAVELVHNGTAFTSFYSSGSTRAPITNGFSFSLVRAGGWTDTSVYLSVYPFADGGTLINFSEEFDTVADPPGIDVALSGTGVAEGTYGNASHVAQFAVNPKGQLTSAASVSIAIPSTAITDSTTDGRALLTAANVAAQQGLLGLGFGVANAAALNALPVTNLGTGAPRWVATYRRPFILDKSVAAATLGADPGNVIIAADGTSRWIAKLVPDAYWLSKTAISINPLATDDEGVNPKTLRELDRRLFGSMYDNQPIFTLLNDVPLSDATVLHNVRSANGLGFPTMVGTKTQIGGDYVVTSFAPANSTTAGGGTAYLVNATGIGDSSNVGMLIENIAGTKVAWIQKSTGANQVRINTPSNGDPLSGSSGSAVSLAGETLRVYQLTRLPVYPFGPLAGYNALAWCRVGFGYAGGNFHTGQIGAAAPFVSRCKTEGACMDGGISGAWVACNFTPNGGGPTSLNNHTAFVSFCAVSGGYPALLWQSNGRSICQATSGNPEETALDIQASSIGIESAHIGGGIWSLSAFDCTHSIFSVSGKGSIQQFPGAMYGTGNTSYLISGPAGGTKAEVNVAGLNLGTTKPKLALIGGVERDIPFVGLASLGLANGL